MREGVGEHEKRHNAKRLYRPHTHIHTERCAYTQKKYMVNFGGSMVKTANFHDTFKPMVKWRIHDNMWFNVAKLRFTIDSSPSLESIMVICHFHIWSKYPNTLIHLPYSFFECRHTRHLHSISFPCAYFWRI